MIAEVSGLADVLLVFSRFIMTLLITKRLLASMLAHNVGQVEHERVSIEKPLEANIPHKNLLSKAFRGIKKRFRIKLTAWQIFIAYFLPRGLRSDLTNKTLDLAELNLKRMEKSLDVERIIQSHLDLEQLLNSLMSKRSLWLFRQARSRVISL